MVLPVQCEGLTKTAFLSVQPFHYLERFCFGFLFLIHLESLCIELAFGVSFPGP